MTARARIGRLALLICFLGASATARAQDPAPGDEGAAEGAPTESVPDPPPGRAGSETPEAGEAEAPAAGAAATDPTGRPAEPEALPTAPDAPARPGSLPPPPGSELAVPPPPTTEVPTDRAVTPHDYAPRGASWRYEAREIPEGPPVEAPPRSFGERYADALAGSWAATGIMALAVGVTAGTLGVAVGCPFGVFGCIIGVVSGLGGGGGVGWALGPGIGTARGAGLDPGEGFLMWALGLLTNGAIVALGAGIGALTDTGRSFGNPGLGLGIGIASAIGAVTQVFVTPLYAVAIYEDRPDARDTPTLRPYAAPTADGFTAGLGASF